MHHVPATQVKSYLSILRERDVVAGEEEDEDGNVTRDSRYCKI